MEITKEDNMGVEVKIKAVYRSLTKSEQKVADYMLEAKDEMISQTLDNLSKAIGVGEATIIRFLNKCGYDTLHAFKFDVVRDSEKTKQRPTELDLIEALSDEIRKEIENTTKSLNKKQVKEIVQLFAKARNVYFMGIGHSGIVAEMGAYRSQRIGRNARSITDMHYQAIQATLCSEEDLIIAVSLKGVSRELNAAVEIAQAKKARVVAIVSNLQSELAQQADYVLLATSERVFARYDGTGIDAIITQLMMIEFLLTEYSHLDFEGTKDLAEEITMSFTRQVEKYSKKR